MIFLQAAGAFDGYGEECEGKDVCIGPIIKVHIVKSNDDRSSMYTFWTSDNDGFYDAGDGICKPWMHNFDSILDYI